MRKNTFLNLSLNLLKGFWWRKVSELLSLSGRPILIYVYYYLSWNKESLATPLSIHRGASWWRIRIAEWNGGIWDGVKGRDRRDLDSVCRGAECCGWLGKQDGGSREKEGCESCWQGCQARYCSRERLATKAVWCKMMRTRSVAERRYNNNSLSRISEQSG